MLIFAVIIGVVVLIHELGHFLAAKAFGIKVEEFAFGFGPKLISKKIGDTEYMLKAFPIGGYVKLLGEEEESKSKQSFSEKPVYARATVAMSGILMNFVLAVVLFYAVLWQRGFEYDGIPYYEDLNVWFGEQEEVLVYPVTVVGLVEGGSAEDAGLEDYFEILEINNKEIGDVDEMKEILKDNKEQQVGLKIRYEDGKEEDIKLWTDEDGMIGVELIDSLKVWRVTYRSPEKIVAGFEHFANMTEVNVFVLGKLITESVEERSVKPVSQAVSGPIGLFVVIDIVKDFGGFWGMLDLVANLNLTLVLVNILPFPALDGGHTFLLILEAIRGKPINRKVERVMVNIGMIMLFGFMFVITAKDIFQFGVWDWVKDRASDLGNLIGL